MKTIYAIERTVGGDGLAVSGEVGVQESNLKVQVALEYPIEMIVKPATTAVDGLIDKLKILIPGTWDDALLEDLKKEYKEELVKLLSE